VANYGSNNVSAFTINAATGALNAVANSPFAVGAGMFPQSVTVDPSGKFAYVANDGGKISAFTIDSATGALSAVAGSPFAAGPAPRSVTVDPSGKFAYVANSGSNDVSAFSIDATSGALTAAGTMRARARAMSLAVTKGTTPVTYSPRFAYVANLGSNNVSAHTINATTGALTAIGSPIATGTRPISVTVDPSGKFAYVANDGSNNVSAFTINAASGALSAVAGSPFAAGTRPLSVAVDPSGRFVYVANVGSGVADPGTVSAYTMNPTTGALSAVAGSPFAAGGGPDAVVVDPTGRFLYVANYGFPGSGTVSAYTINPATGVLAAVSGSPFPSGGSGSDSVTVDSSGRFVYVTNLLSDTVTAYTINAATGALTRIGTQDLVVTNARPVSITMNPARGFVYLATACGNVWAFSINTTSGVLTRIDSAPGGLCFAFRDAPNATIVDPSGRFVYNVDYSIGDSVSGYTIDAATGALTPVSGSPFAAGPHARSVATSGVIE
jgi:6-phosphogluconolactonase (cycloisomerase 2 family)